MFNGSFLRVYRILRFVKAVVSLFIFPTGPIALDCEPRGRRFIKNTGHNRNRLYSRAIHCPASMEKHYVQWFDIMEPLNIMLLHTSRTMDGR